MSRIGWGYFDLGVVECNTLFIDHCLIYENLLSLGILSICDTFHDFA